MGDVWSREQARRSRRLHRRESIEGLLLYAPALLVIGFVVLFPMGFAVTLSTQSWHLTRMAQRGFVGLRNFQTILSDPDWWASLRRGLVFTFGSLIPMIVLGLAVAQLLNDKNVRAKTLWRSLAVLPWLVPVVTVAIIFRWMFNDVYGILNFMLVRIGLLDAPVAWLSDGALAMFVLILANVWRALPLMVVMALAGLQGIPDEYYQSAEVDGATGWQVYWHITLPLLMPVIMIVAILRFVWIFNFFDLPWVMTMGGPAGATRTPPVYAYLRAFSGHRLGQGAAITLLLFVILAAFATVYFIAQKRYTTEQ